jgi:hypothetical protein
MNDHTVLAQIQKLSDEEYQLREHAEGRGLSDAEQQRLQSIEVHLDQCWDLLRQRRAKRQAGLNPDDAHERDPETVERYQQ